MTNFLTINQNNTKMSKFSRILSVVLLVGMLMVLTLVPAFADGGLAGKITKAAEDVINFIQGVASVVAAAVIAVALFVMNFSKSGKSVDESRAWIKRTIVCYAGIMLVTLIMEWITGIVE